MNIAQAERNEQLLEEIRVALTGYHRALDQREHGGTAAARMVNTLENILQQPWVRGSAGSAAPPDPAAEVEAVLNPKNEENVPVRSQVRVYDRLGVKRFAAFDMGAFQRVIALPPPPVNCPANTRLQHAFSAAVGSFDLDDGSRLVGVLRLPFVPLEPNFGFPMGVPQWDARPKTLAPERAVS